MKIIRLAAAALNQTALDWENNKRNIIDALSQARACGVQVLCLPELCVSGYGCEDAFHAIGVSETALTILHEILPFTQGIAVSLGLPICYQGVVFNAACFVQNGDIRGFVAKKNLAGDGVHYEQRWFKAWPIGQRVDLDVRGRAYPLGDLIFELGDIRIAHEICEDAWVAKRAAAELSNSSFDIVLNPSASHFAFGKHAIRKRLVLEGSRAFSAAYAYANLLGCESGRVIYDGDCLIAMGGEIKTQTLRFSYKKTVLAYSDVDIDVLRLNRARSLGTTAQFVKDLRVVSCSAFGQGPTANLVKPPVVAPCWEDGASTKQEEFARALSLGLYDYTRKSRSRGVVISLSGGADSSALSCIVALMLQFAESEIGLEGLRSDFSFFREVSAAQSIAQITQLMLCCVYQSTKQSSLVTSEAATTLAEALGATYFKFDVQKLTDEYIELVGKAAGHSFDWKTDDLALQNIQARVRSPGVWLLANLRGALLLTTSNRSEAAVGYATMDGDTSGGLCPLGGIDKAFLREWLTWLETEGPEGLSAIPALKKVTAQAPTAELRPADAHQTDEGDLMPYVVLDKIERHAIRDKRMPLESFKLLSSELRGQYTETQLREWVIKFYTLWARSQWKRERFAPSFHLDDENLDPKTWCRFPILSGGFERELTELKGGQ